MFSNNLLMMTFQLLWFQWRQQRQTIVIGPEYTQSIGIIEVDQCLHKKKVLGTYNLSMNSIL